MKAVRIFNIIFSVVMISACLFMTNLVMAQTQDTDKPKSFYIEKKDETGVLEVDPRLTTSMEKEGTVGKDSFSYRLDIVRGNVIKTNELTGGRSVVYDGGNAQYLSEVNYYYYGATYIVIITDNGDLYSNVYTNNEGIHEFRKVETNNPIVKLKVLEHELKYSEYPNVEVYGVDVAGNWELIRM